jgi:hypothetical protein
MSVANNIRTGEPTIRPPNINMSAAMATLYLLEHARDVELKLTRSRVDQRA